jgi:hypothetical protein
MWVQVCEGSQSVDRGFAALQDIVPGTEGHMTQALASMGRIKVDFDGLISITLTGRRHIGVADTPKTVAAARKISHVGTYDGAELLPYTGRPGSEAALALPSRLPDGLHYRDGRVVPFN